jgi:hypothetical protein
VKAIPLLAVLAVAGFALAACGSAGTVADGPGTTAFTGPITTTVSDLGTGDTVTCDGHGGAKVPPPGQGVGAIADGTSPASSSDLALTRRGDGSLVVSCTP